jgi:hypothetical protein
MVTEQPQASWGLDPRYVPVDKDSGILVRFMGNTARIVAVEFIGQVDAGQMTYLARWLTRQADKIEQVAEAKGASEHIVTPRDLPVAPGNLASLLPPGLRGR